MMRLIIPCAFLFSQSLCENGRFKIRWLRSSEGCQRRHLRTGQVRRVIYLTEPFPCRNSFVLPHLLFLIPERTEGKLLSGRQFIFPLVFHTQPSRLSRDGNGKTKIIPNSSRALRAWISRYMVWRCIRSQARAFQNRHSIFFAFSFGPGFPSGKYHTPIF